MGLPQGIHFYNNFVCVWGVGTVHAQVNNLILENIWIH